ncbi:MAG: glycosyltransferase family 39 protein [Actinobacteria bacterium]|nr:glycosyltransferase family 39 protein [Actinomycetota bacterium]
MRRRGLIGAVALAAVIRLTYFVSKWDQMLLLNDSVYYSGQARQLFEGVWFREVFFPHQPGAEHGPLTSILMAPVSIGDTFFRWQRLVTVITGVLLVWVLGRFVEELAGRRAGVAAAFIAAVYPNLWMNDGLVMSESVSTLFVGLSMWAAWRLARDGERRQALLLGVALGLGVLARSELVLFVPLVAGWVILARRRDWRPALMVIGTAGLVVAPWVVFNLTRFERPVFLTTNDGTTWLGANCDDMYHGAGAGGWSIACVVRDPDYLTDEEPSVRSARQRSLAVDYITDHAGQVPKVVVARVLRTMDLYGRNDLVQQDVGEERPRWASWVGIVMFWLLAALSVAGVRLLPRRAWSLLVLPFVVVLCTTVLFYGGHRIRSTAEPSLVALSGVAVAALVPARRSAE